MDSLIVHMLVIVQNKVLTVAVLGGVTAAP